MAKDRFTHELVLRKSDQTWNRIPISLDRFQGVRSFSHFLAWSETLPKGPGVQESAGRDEWRENSSQYGPGIAWLLRDSSLVYTGRLYLYDIDTGRDSEVLLVENNVVF